MKKFTVVIGMLFTCLAWQSPSWAETASTETAGPKPTSMSEIDTFFAKALSLTDEQLNITHGAFNCGPSLHPQAYQYAPGTVLDLDSFRAWGESQGQAHAGTVAKCVRYLCSGAMSDAVEQGAMDILEQARKILEDQNQFNEQAEAEYNGYVSELPNTRRECTSANGALTRMMIYDTCTQTTGITCSR